MDYTMTSPIGVLMQQVLECVEPQLTTPVGLAAITPGNTVAWDNCCDGELYVRVVSIVGASGLSRPAMQPCLPLYQCRIAIGVIRCAHTVNDQGKPPTAEEMSADADLTLQDAHDLATALACCVSQIPGIETLSIEDWLPQGPQGGCVGGEYTATFKYVLCAPCAEN